MWWSPLWMPWRKRVKSTGPRWPRLLPSMGSMLTSQIRHAAKEETVVSIQEVRVPDLGGADEVEVIEISVSPGDSVEQEQSLIVVESDKATVELPSPAAGTIQEIKVSVGDKVTQGDLVALLETAQAQAAREEPAPAADQQTPEATAPAAEPVAAPEESQPETREEVVKVPDIGEAQGVTVIEVSVQPGDRVEAEGTLIVLESDKATMEIPSPAAGVVQEVLVKVNDSVDEGTPIARMLLEAQPQQKPAPAAKPEPSQPAAIQPEPAPEPSKPAPAPARGLDEQSAERSARKVHAGPAVRKLAREFGVDLGLVKGTGPKQRILKDDVQGFVKESLKHVTNGGGGTGLPAVKLPDFSQFGKIERRPMSKIHRATAENMARSWLNVPHVTQFDEADITELEAFRKAQKQAGEQRGLKLTLLPFLLKACAYALRTFPQFNVSLDTQTWEVIQKDYLNIGLAVDTPAGLMVPVIREVDQKSLWELARETADLAARARDRKLTPAEMQGGCFTISSLGGIGGTAFTPIVNTPEVAILGVSKAQIKPVYQNDQFVPRLMLPLSLSYDHRAINGADAARFTALLGELLGDIRRLLL